MFFAYIAHNLAAFKIFLGDPAFHRRSSVVNSPMYISKRGGGVECDLPTGSFATSRREFAQ